MDEENIELENLDRKRKKGELTKKKNKKLVLSMIMMKAFSLLTDQTLISRGWMTTTNCRRPEFRTLDVMPAI